MKKLLITVSFLANFIFLFIYLAEIKIHSNYPINCNVDSIELDSFTPYEIFSDRDLIPERKKAIEMYREFLSGDRCIGEDDNKIDISFLTIPKGEPDRHYYAEYSIFDLDSNVIPKLHIRTARYYYILGFKDNGLFIWKNLSPNPRYHPINNGAFISYSAKSAPMRDIYSYLILDDVGEVVLEFSFSKCDSNQNGIYDESDEYFFDGAPVTKENWNALTRRYLFVDLDGLERIRDEIEWIVIYESTT